MSGLWLAVAWTLLGAAVGTGLNYLSRWLARIEEIEFRQSLPEVMLMPLLTAGLFLALIRAFK